MSVNYLNDKNINTKDFYIAIQISRTIDKNYKNLPNEVCENSLIIHRNLIKLFSLTPAKLHQVFSNNLADTNFIAVSMDVLVKLKNNVTDNLVLLLCQNIISITWNCTDSSEKFCNELLKNLDFKNIITDIFNGRVYNEQNKIFVQGSTSIINNIIRRENLRNSFDSYDLCSKLEEIFNSPLTERPFKIITTAMIFYLVRDNKIKCYTSMVEAIRDDIIEIVDDASNNSSFQSEGFTMKELMDIIRTLCRDPDVKLFVSNNNSFLASLIRILGKNYLIETIIKLAKFIYTDDKYEQFKKTYIEKYGSNNVKVLDLFVTI